MASIDFSIRCCGGQQAIIDLNTSLKTAKVCKYTFKVDVVTLVK